MLRIKQFLVIWWFLCLLSRHEMLSHLTAYAFNYQDYPAQFEMCQRNHADNLLNHNTKDLEELALTCKCTKAAWVETISRPRHLASFQTLLTSLFSFTTTICLSPRALNNLKTRERDTFWNKRVRTLWGLTVVYISYRLYTANVLKTTTVFRKIELTSCTV